MSAAVPATLVTPVSDSLPPSGAMGWRTAAFALVHRSPDGTSPSALEDAGPPSAGVVSGRGLARVQLTGCPISWAPPFEPPWKRALCPDVVRRLSAWCAELLPGVEVDVVEWVGADPRQPIHALVVGFPTSQRSPVVLYRKSEELERHHLARALWEKAASTPG